VERKKVLVAVNRRKKILVAPLDWGLGHATRCVAIINEVLKYDVDVVIASDNLPYQLLHKEFPRGEHLRFPGYSVKYIDKGNLGWAIIRQLPAILSGFKKEHGEVEAMVRQHNIDAIISDSRFGVHCAAVPSVFVIHQLHMLLPRYLRWGEDIVASVNRYLCNKFSECWVSDFAGPVNLGGKLSHPRKLPNNTFYIGPVSRLKAVRAKKEIDILAILSGPEPQRRIFEEILLQQLQQTNYRSVIVRGKTDRRSRRQITEHITMIDSMQTEELSKMISSSKMVVSRGGYCTIMDLSLVGANAIFVPTPQQTEQEYTAGELKKQKICYSEPQNEFSLERSLEKSKEYTGFTQLQSDGTLLRQRIEHLLDSIGY
jgi:uncharacterized protein (TIGR00661 family)